MLSSYLSRGLKAGLLAGLVFGLFVALVATPMIGVAQELGGQEHADHAEEGSIGALADATSVAGGVLFGVLLGLSFGAAFYFLEPAIPGASDTQSYLLAAAGLITVSGAPWLVVPPQPPGVEALLPTGVRIGIYTGMLALGALACLAAGGAFNRLRGRGYEGKVALAGGALPLVALGLLGVLAPTEPVTGSTPAALTAGYRWLVVTGQLGLWATLAAAHAWLLRRASNDATATTPTLEGGLTPADD